MSLPVCLSICVSLRIDYTTRLSNVPESTAASMPDIQQTVASWCCRLPQHTAHCLLVRCLAAFAVVLVVAVADPLRCSFDFLVALVSLDLLRTRRDWERFGPWCGVHGHQTNFKMNVTVSSSYIVSPQQ